MIGLVANAWVLVTSDSELNILLYEACMKVV